MAALLTVRPDGAPPRHWADAPASWLAGLVPLAVTLLRVAQSSQWRDDVAVVRGLGFVPLGLDGTPSAVLAQLFSLLPIGGRLLRAGLVGALGVALLGSAAFHLARRVLERDRTPSLATALLALGAALGVTLGAACQAEATVAGGATFGAALLLAGVAGRPLRMDDARLWALSGLVLGLTFAESLPAGALLLALLAAQLLVLRERPPRAGALWLGGMAVGVYAVALLPQLLRPLTTGGWLTLGMALSTAGLTPVDIAARPAAALAWLADTGPLYGALALVGLVWALLRPALRPVVAPLLLVLAVDVAFPASGTGLLAADPLAPIRLAALGVLAVCAACGAQLAAGLLERSRLPFARQSSLILVTATFTVVLVAAEDAGNVADRRQQLGVEAWTDESLAGLPPRSVLIATEEAVVWRLWASLVVRSDRPDLLVVPLPLLARGNVARSLLAREPALAPVIRDMALTGRVGEYALSNLADARPTFVELDPRWDRRILEHLTPGPGWLRFSPHALGRSDRKESLGQARTAVSRVVAQTQGADPTKLERRDVATLRVLARRLREQLATLLALRDVESAALLVADLRVLEGNDPKLEALAKQLADGKLPADPLEVLANRGAPAP